MGNSQKSHKHCVFCEIISEIGKDDALDSDRILCYDNNFVVMSDLHPAAKHHYLVIPITHVNNPKELKGAKDAELVKKMYECGKNFLNSVESDTELLEDSLFGFHYPPFVSIEHLHLHIICPASNMDSTNASLFRKDTWYFVSPEKLMETLLSS